MTENKELNTKETIISKVSGLPIHLSTLDIVITIISDMKESPVTEILELLTDLKNVTQTKNPERLFTKKDISDRELTLKGKIKNLQVSISIFKKEYEDLEFKLEHSDEATLETMEEKWKARMSVLSANIAKKEKELEPLKAEREAAKTTAKSEEPATETE